jgi:hypothetical protein
MLHQPRGLWGSLPFGEERGISILGEIYGERSEHLNEYVGSTDARYLGDIDEVSMRNPYPIWIWTNTARPMGLD